MPGCIRITTTTGILGMNYIPTGIMRRSYNSERRVYTIRSCIVLHSDVVASQKPCASTRKGIPPVRNLRKRG
jgi:hypothetical protein